MRENIPRIEIEDLRWTERRFRFAILTTGVLAGIAIYVLGRELFPLLSLNHDEGVYLNQAALLTQGKLWFTSDIPDIVRPWFFVKDGNRLYPKYTPVAAILFAPGVALGIPRLMLSVIAAGNIALTGLIGRELFDRTTGVLAATLALAAPMFLFLSATFMAYMPTHLLNLLFAFCYIRTFSGGGYRYAMVAGSAIGLAFFSRPFTAVLFAIPFLIHALWLATGAIKVHRQAHAYRELAQLIVGPTIERLGLIALFGGAGTVLALTYNNVVTGNAFLFPYQAFSPLDGLGFGQHRLTGPIENYTVELAIRSNIHLIAELLTQWTVAAPIGSVLAAIGLFPLAQRRWERHTRTTTFRLVVLGVFVSVSVGNVYFWGTYKILGEIPDPTDGFIGVLGPFYHTDLLFPLSVFGAAGGVWIGRTLSSHLADRRSKRAARTILLVVLVVSMPVVASAEHSRLASPIERHTDYREATENMNGPFEEQSFDNAFVFLPQTQGPWLAHPFQWLRNDGSPDRGNVIYGLNNKTPNDFAAFDAHPDRTFYRYQYQGDWNSPNKDEIEPHLQRISVRNGTNHQLETTVGDLGHLESVQLTVGQKKVIRNNYQPLTETTEVSPSGRTNPSASEATTIRWTINGTHVTLLDSGDVNGTPQTTRYNPATGRVDRVFQQNATDTNAIELNGTERPGLSLTFKRPNGKRVTYRVGIDLEANGDSVRIIWPGEAQLCQGSFRCGRVGTVVPGGSYPNGSSINTTLETSGRN